MPAAPAQGGNQAIMQFRKALGVPDNQPAPEQKVIDACMGKLGPDLKRMAVAVAGASPAGVPAATSDPSQAGGESAPPDPNSPDTADSPAVQPGNQTQGKMGAATIFGRRPVGTIGEQGDQGEPDEDDQAPPRASGIFGRRR